MANLGNKWNDEKKRGTPRPNERERIAVRSLNDEPVRCTHVPQRRNCGVVSRCLGPDAGLDYRNAADVRRGSIVKTIEFALLFSFGRRAL
jgi:hypothetical protein